MEKIDAVLALANLLLCIFAVGMCLCRLNNIHKNVALREKFKYVAALAAAMASATQPWYGEQPGWGSLAMAASLVYALYIGASRWRHGVPAYVQTTKDPNHA